MNKSLRGGPRKGAGRKPVEGRPEMKSVKLSQEHWEKAREIGGGNMAEGLRRALDAMEDAKRYKWLKACKGLELCSGPQPNNWTLFDGLIFSSSYYLAEGGTQHSPGKTLDEIIDKAITPK